MTDERNDIDKELEAYLEGRDGLSDTYRKLEDVAPPVELDARILQAARDELERGSQQSSRTPNKSIYSRPYAIAASVLLGILIGVMIAPQPPMNTQTDETAALPEVASEAPAAFQAEADMAPAPLNESEQETLESAVAREVSPTETMVAGADSASGARLQQAASAASDTEEARDTGALQQITVTGSRISDTPYRNNPDTWLAEIRRLQQESDNTLATLEQEITLFREAHPDIDLPAASNE